MQNPKEQFIEILKYAYSRDGEENLTTEKFVDELKERLQSLIVNDKEG